MVNTTDPPTTTISPSDKLLALPPITSLVPITLDLDKSNYSSWSYFFRIHCEGLDLLDHITKKPASTGPESSAEGSAAPTVEWLKVNSVVKKWIFLTSCDVLVGLLVKANPRTALDAWEFLANIFLDNKRTKSIALRGELRVLNIGDMSVDAYFAKIEKIATLLNDLGSPIHDDDLMTYALNGLNDRFAHVAGIIAHRDPFPNLDMVRSMVTTEDLRLKHKTNPSYTITTPSAPQVLLAETSTRDNKPRDTRGSSTGIVCRHFSRTGLCKWGNGCKFVHENANRGNSLTRGNTISHNSSLWSTNSLNQSNNHAPCNTQSSNELQGMGQAKLIQLVQAQQRLLAQYGLNDNITQAQRVLQAQQQLYNSNRSNSSTITPPGFGTIPGQQAHLASTVHQPGSQA
ncbi:myb-like protein P [Artemisia annua]|uniref:Myb-like protein P n=1 Tax=Artemisia annua TaxID=35608 RepID=A0A2U1LHM5_ARTAN|nr:myb-like protein P [Artemisia annua]